VSQWIGRFFCFGNTVADAAIAILLPTLKHFSGNGAGHNVCLLWKRFFYKNNDNFVIAQRKFRRGFGIHCSRVVPSTHAIKTWVRNLEATGSTLNTNGGSVKTVRTLENIAVVRDVINALSPELNPICYFLALLAHDFLRVSRIRVKSLTLRLLMSYIYGAPILEVSRSHTTTQHSR
jgi:hypothetical protein